MKMVLNGLFALTLIAALASSVGAEPFHPASHQQSIGLQQQTSILVLGTPHLAQEPETFDRRWLDPLLSHLESYRPAAIVVESLSGEAVHALLQYEAVYPGVAKMFAARRIELAREAAALLETTTPAAERTAREMLRSPSRLGPAGRRRLCAWLIASGDLNSALVQWLKLERHERVAKDGISKAAATHLQKSSLSRNETISIAIQLTQRLGLERVYSMDDQSESDLVFPTLKEVGDAEASASLAASRARHPLPRFTAMTSPDSVLVAFRQHNSDLAGRQDAAHQWLARLEAGEYQATLRMRVAAWEARNLRMAANVREVSAKYPGKNILVIVGSAHKPYLDAYLRLMSDARVVAASSIIGAAH